MLGNVYHCKMARSKRKGRHLVATSDLTPGTVIIREQAFGAISNSPLYCSNCFCRLSTAAVDRPYVCCDCQSEGPVGFSRSDKSLVILCYKIVLRMLLQEQFSYEAFLKEKLKRESAEDVLEVYSNDFRAVAKLVTVDLDVSSSDIDKVCTMILKRTSRLSKDQIKILVQHVFSSLPCNVQGIRCITEKDGNFSDERIGSGLYLSLALMNHSCSPNTRIYFENSDVVVITTTKVEEGEELFHNYGPNVLHFPKNERQEILARQYQFVCDCTACSGSEDEPQYAMRCEHCSASIWLDSDVSTCSSCLRQVDIAKLSRRLYFLHQKLVNLQEDPDIDFIDDIVDEAMRLYSSENVTFGNIMDSCASLYASKKVWDKAISCAKFSCSVVEKAIGKLNQTYAIELLKFCEIRKDSLAKDAFDDQLVNDALFCVDILQQCKSYGLNRLDRVNAWCKVKATL